MLGECQRVHFTFVFSLSEWVYGLLVAFGSCTGSPSFLSECVSWFLGRLFWLHWVSFCLSECLASLSRRWLGIFYARVSVSWVSWAPLLVVLGFLLLQ